MQFAYESCLHCTNIHQLPHPTLGSKALCQVGLNGTLLSRGSQSENRMRGTQTLPSPGVRELKLVSSLSFSGLTEHLLCPESQDAGLDMQTVQLHLSMMNQSLFVAHLLGASVAAVPNLFDTRSQSWGRQYFHVPGVWGWG